MKSHLLLPPKFSTWLKAFFGLVTIAALFVIMVSAYSSRIFPLQTDSLLPPSDQTSTSDVPQSDPTAGWKTHTDPSRGFSIMYPPAWKVSTNPAKGLGYSFQSPDLTLNKEGPGLVTSGWYMRVVGVANEQDASIHDFRDISLQDWFAQYSREATTTNILSKPTYTKIAGYSAVVFDADTPLFGKTRTAVVVNGNKMFKFDCFYAEKDRQAAIHACESVLVTLQIFP